MSMLLSFLLIREEEEEDQDEEFKISCQLWTFLFQMQKKLF